MKKAIPYVVAVILAVATAALAVRNSALVAELAEVRETLAARESELEKASKQPPAPKARPIRVVERREVEPAPIDVAAFDKAVEERAEALVEERRQQREAEREERRRAWEGGTEEEREARRREFQDRMREHAEARLTEFVEKVGLDDQQLAAVETELGNLDSRVREIVGSFAAAVDKGGKFDFESQMQLLNNMSAAVLDAYTGLDEALPKGWRDRDEEFNVMLGIGPDAFNPLVNSLRKSGNRGFGAFMPFMGGGGPRRRPPQNAGAPVGTPAQP